MGTKNGMDIGEAMDVFYQRRIETEMDEQRDLRKKFLEGVPAKGILFWNTGYQPLEGYLNGNQFIWPEPDINTDAGRMFKMFHTTEVQGHLVIVGESQILGQVWKKVN